MKKKFIKTQQLYAQCEYSKINPKSYFMNAKIHSKTELTAERKDKNK